MYMSFYHERLENNMRNLIIVKYDNSDRIVICTVSSKHLQCVCRHTKIPESKHGIHWTVLTTCYPYEIHWGKIRDFLNRKRLSYFFLQEIPDLFSYHKYSTMQLCIRRCFIICTCKILVQNLIIKDILKKKNDVHWISVRTYSNNHLHTLSTKLIIVRFWPLMDQKLEEST